jgi:hypothetical protein
VRWPAGQQCQETVNKLAKVRTIVTSAGCVMFFSGMKGTWHRIRSEKKNSLRKKETKTTLCFVTPVLQISSSWHRTKFQPSHSYYILHISLCATSGPTQYNGFWAHSWAQNPLYGSEEFNRIWHNVSQSSQTKATRRASRKASTAARRLCSVV